MSKQILEDIITELEMLHALLAIRAQQLRSAATLMRQIERRLEDTISRAAQVAHVESSGFAEIDESQSGI